MIVSVDDVESALGETIPEDAHSQVENLIGDAIAAVSGYLHPASIPDPAPDAVRRVVVRMVVRYLTRGASGAPEGATGVMTVAGAWTRQVQYSSSSTDGGVWMVRQDRVMLRPFKHRRGGITSVEYVR